VKRAILIAASMVFACAGPPGTYYEGPVGPGTFNDGSSPTTRPPPPATYVFIKGALTDVVIDDAGGHVYLTNRDFNQIEDYALDGTGLRSPIPVGSVPASLDFSSDGSLLYVANSGANNVSVVSLETRGELRKIPVPPENFFNDRPYSIAIGNNGKAFLSTTFDGSGFGARMLQLDLATDAVTQRTDFWFSGTTTEVTELKASADRSTIGIVAGDISSAPVFLYRAATDTFTKEKDLNGFIDTVTLDRAGAKVLVEPGSVVLDGSLTVQGTIPLCPTGCYQTQTVASAVSPDGSTGYRAIITDSGGAALETLDLTRFLRVGSIPLPNALPDFFSTSRRRMTISRDGKIAAIISSSGLTVVRL